MIVNAVAIVLLFLLARRLFDDIAGVAAAASYALLSLSPTVIGNICTCNTIHCPLCNRGNINPLESD